MFDVQTVPCYSAEATDAWAPSESSVVEKPTAFDAFAVEDPSSPDSASRGPTPAAQVKDTIQQLLLNAELHTTSRHALLNAMLLLRSKKMVRKPQTYACMHEPLHTCMHAQSPAARGHTDRSNVSKQKPQIPRAEPSASESKPGATIARCRV